MNKSVLGALCPDDCTNASQGSCSKYGICTCVDGFSGVNCAGILSPNKIKRDIFYLGCTQNGVFLKLATEKKTPFLVQLEIFFGPSYFVTALVS